jgi:hypothetical protein
VAGHLDQFGIGEAVKDLAPARVSLDGRFQINAADIQQVRQPAVLAFGHNGVKHGEQGV